MNLSQRIAALPPDRFAKSAYLSADLAIKAAIRAGKEPPKSALFIKSQTPEQLMEQQRKRLALNKAQKDYIESWFEGIESHNIEMSRYDLAGFGKEYGAINPEPDKLLYVMMYKGLTGKWDLNHPETFTKEEADEKLHNLMTESLDYVSEYRAGEYLKLFFPKEENSQEWTQEFRIDLA